jgi:spore coat protein JB
MEDINRENLLREIQAADFALIELNLYLDTHPYEQRTITIYSNMVQRAKMLRDTYERLYGPLTITSPYVKCPWQWIDSPWPWEG